MSIKNYGKDNPFEEGMPLCIGDRFRFDEGNRAGEIHEVTWIGRRWFVAKITGGRGPDREEKTEIIFARNWNKI